MQRALVLVKVLYELGYAALVVDLVRFLGLFAFILDKDADAFVRKRFFAEPFGELVKAVNGRFKNIRVRLEGDLCSAFGRLAGLGKRGHGNTDLEFHLMCLAVAPELKL